jgi:hypothetical protein
LYNVHRGRPVILEGEPKYVDSAKLTSCKINATYARTSILEYTGILMSRGDGYVRPGEENNDLGIEDDSSEIQMQSRDQQESKSAQNIFKDEILGNNANYTLPDSALLQSCRNDAMETTYPCYSLTLPSSPSEDAQQQQERDEQYQLRQEQQMETMSPSVPQPTVIPAMDAQPLDVFYPFFDPQMIGLFPNGEMPDLSPFETNTSGLNYFEIEGWNNSSSLTAYSSVGESRIEGEH